MRAAKVQASLRGWACASAQSRQNIRCSLIQAVSQEEPSDRKPDPWPLWMAGHAQLKFVMKECSKTQIRLTGLNSFQINNIQWHSIAYTEVAEFGASANVTHSNIFHQASLNWFYVSLYVETYKDLHDNNVWNWGLEFYVKIIWKNVNFTESKSTFFLSVTFEIPF